MKLRKIIGHTGLVVCMLFLLVGLPILTHFRFDVDQTADAVSSASIALPDQPSGDFIVLINTKTHSKTLHAWRSFFLDEDFPVIFEDIQCIAAEGDATGQQMAERYLAELPENQMKLRTENPTLLASKAEAGYIDVAIFSREMADALKLSPDTNLVTVIEVSGGGN